VKENLSMFSNEDLVRLFRYVHKEHRTHLQSYLNQFDLYVGQPPVLFFIEAREKVTQKQVVEVMETTKEATCMTIKRLINTGMVTKVQDEKDRRVNWISLTPKGQDVVELCRKNYRATNEKMFAHFSKEDKETLEVLLRKIQLGLKENKKIENR